jgi:hypothetical protein
MTFRARSLPLLITLVLTAALHAEMTTRTFKVPPDFLSCDIADRGSAAAPAAPADPFAAGGAAALHDRSAPPQPTSALRTLEAQGITFPKGAGASFNPVTGTLTITNTPENLEIAELFVQSLHNQAPANVAFTLTVIEGPGELIRAANDTASHAVDATPALLALLKQSGKADSNVRVVADAFIETKSGTRATTEAVREHSHVTEFNLDAKSRASIAKEMRQLGLRLEIEPTVGANGTRIETTFNLTLNAAPAVQRQVSVNDPLTGNAAEFPVTDVPGARFVSGMSIRAGHTKLLGVTKPVGTPQENADILCAAFLTATLRRVEALPAPQAQVPAPASVPKGMIFATLPVPDGLFAPFINWPKIITLQSWLSQAGITFPPGSSIVHRDGVLQLVNTPDNIALITTVVDHEMSVYAKTVAFTLHTLEAPAALLRDLARQSLAGADDSAMFAAVEAAATRGEARFIDSIFLETKSGTRASHQAAREHRYLENFGTDAQGRPDLSFETRNVGSILEVEPVIGADGRTVELNVMHELHVSPPMPRRDHFRDPASQKPFDMPITDFHVHKTTTGISLAKGSTKLLSLAAPFGQENSAVLRATFLKCDVVPQVAASHHAISEPAPEIKPPSDPKAWHTRTFRVPPDFLSIGGDSSRKTAKMILESQGITFPEGASANYSAPTTMMVVRNTNENLDLVEAFLDTMCYNPPISTVFSAHVLQAPGPLLRRLTAKAASKSNHRAELDELLAAVKAGTVQHLNTARIETKSGTRSTAEQVTEHIAVSEVGVTDKGVPSLATEMRQVGLRLELEPTVGADGVTVELTLAPESHTAPPFEHREHVIDTQGRRLEFPLTDYHAAKVTTGITMPDGTVRLLSLHKPTGRPEFEKEDILQAIFITCDILRDR